MKNIFDELPYHLEQEVFETLISSDVIKVERIISNGHTTTIGEWYDQDLSEWVMVLKGAAQLVFEGSEPVHLSEGSYINIPAHQKHRVEWTDPTQETIWLAVHYAAGESGMAHF